MAEDKKESRSKAKKNKENFLIALSAKSGNVNKACIAVGITRRTYQTYMKEDADFAEKYWDVKKGFCDFAREGLLKHGIKDWRALDAYLKGYDPEHFANQKNDADMTGDIFVTLPPEFNIPEGFED